MFFPNSTLSFLLLVVGRPGSPIIDEFTFRRRSRFFINHIFPLLFLVFLVHSGWPGSPTNDGVTFRSPLLRRLLFSHILSLLLLISLVRSGWPGWRIIDRLTSRSRLFKRVSREGGKRGRNFFFIRISPLFFLVFLIHSG